MKRWLILIAGVLMAMLTTFGQDKIPFAIDEKFNVSEGKKFVEYYLSTDTVISPLERYVEMRSGTAQSIKRYLFVTTQSQKWLYFRVTNTLQRPYDMLIEMGNFGLNGADYYVFFRDAIIDSGSIKKRWGLHTSEFYDRNIIIPYRLDPDKEYSFLIRVYTNAPLFDLPVIFWKKNAKMNRSQAIELGRGLFYGVLAFFIMVTGMVVYLIRERSYVYYWLYLSIGALLLLLKSGIPLEIFWAGRSYFDFIALNFSLYAYMIITLIFLREFLSEHINANWHITFIRIFLFAGSIFFIIYIPLSYLMPEWQDTMAIIQTVYVNLTNVLVVVIIFWALTKIQEKGPLIVALLYYLVFSTYLFNPFIEFGFLTGKAIGHVLVYTGGILIGFLLVFLTSIRIKNVFERNQLIRQQLSNLNKIYSYSLIQGQEKERKRVAEELHDGIGAHLSVIKMRFSSIFSSSSNTEDYKYNSILENIDESCRRVREMSHELMPPALKRFGLAPALKDMMKYYQQTYPVKLNFRSNLSQITLDEMSQVTIYRLMHHLMELLVHTHINSLDIKMILLPSVQKATIKIQYSGTNLDAMPEEEVNSLKSLIDLLQGRLDTYMSNIWDDEMNIEIPVIILDNLSGDE